MDRKRWLWIGGGVLVAAIAVVAIVVASGGSDKPADKEGATAPLTGLPDPDGIANHRPAITVKINNTDANVQSGITQADVVYEEVVETGITRLAAIFNSHNPSKVGPVRSVRRTDQSIVWPVGGVFVFSGGAQYALDSIDTAPVVQLDETRAGSMMFRDPSPVAPYNLFARLDQMFAAEKDAEPVPPPPLFSYRDPDLPAPGTPVSSFDVGFAAGFATTWTWDTREQSWLRTTQPPAAASTDAEGVRIAPKNVVVMRVNYLGGVGVEGSEAELTGSGDALVFTGGREIKGRWTRDDKQDPAKLIDADGNEILLTPGQTWVELPDVSYDVTVTPAPAS